MTNQFRQLTDEEFKIIEKAMDRMYRDYENDATGEVPLPPEDLLEEDVLVAYFVDADKEFVVAVLVTKPFDCKDTMFVGSTKRMHRDDFDMDIGKSIALTRAVRCTEPVVL
jgi:hypothetical protein